MKTIFNTNDERIIYSYYIDEDGKFKLTIEGIKVDILNIDINTSSNRGGWNKGTPVPDEMKQQISKTLKRRTYNTNCGVKIMGYMPEWMLKRYCLEHGMEFCSRRELAEYCGITEVAISSWKNKRYVEYIEKK